MPRNMTTRSGMRMTTIQAPDRNLVEAMTRATTSVVSAPSPLIAKLRRQHFFSLRRRNQWRNIPHWDKVNDMKTQTTYRLMRLMESRWKLTSRMMPLPDDPNIQNEP